MLFLPPRQLRALECVLGEWCAYHYEEVPCRTLRVVRGTHDAELYERAKGKGRPINRIVCASVGELAVNEPTAREYIQPPPKPKTGKGKGGGKY